MRKYFATSDETRDILRGHEANVARAKHCSPSYIYNIKNMDEPDPYPPFREWFSDCAFGGAPVRIYLNDLESILYQAENGIKKGQCLVKESLEQISKNAERIKILTAVIEDGKIDCRECDKILEIAEGLEADSKRLKEMVLNWKNAANSGAKTAKV